LFDQGRQLPAIWLHPLLFVAEQDAEDIYDGIVDSWVVSRSATLEQQVAGLRLVMACLECWLYQYPLTEESLVQKLGTWALAGK